MAQKILGYILTFIQISVCTILFSWIIYLRLFRWGSFREVATDLLETANYYRLAIIIYIIILLCIILIRDFKKLYGMQSKWKFGFLELIAQFVDDSLNKFFNVIDWLFYKAGMRRDHLLKFGLFLTRVFDTLTKLEILVYLIYVFPRFIYIIVFVTDVFVFHQFYYVFKFSGLLLIPFFLRHIEDLYRVLIEESYTALEGIFFIIDDETQIHYTLREYYWIGFSAQIDGKEHPIQKYTFELHPEYISRETERAALLGKYPDFEEGLIHHVTAYSDVYFHLKHFFSYYIKSKTDLKEYSDILFTISYIIIWTSILIVTI